MQIKPLVFVNTLLVFSMPLQILTGLLMSTWDLEWAHEVHEINGPLLAVLFVGHIIFNWGWIKNNFFKLKKKTF